MNALLKIVGGVNPRPPTMITKMRMMRIAAAQAFIAVPLTAIIPGLLVRVAKAMMAAMKMRMSMIQQLKWR